VAVPSPLFAKATPLGKVPDRLREGAGGPTVVTVKLAEAPTVDVVLLPLVNTGG